MKIDLPLEIDDVVWIITNREPYKRTIEGVRHEKNGNRIITQYILKEYASKDIDFVYFHSKKDAEIEIAKRILEGLKDES